MIGRIKLLLNKHTSYKCINRTCHINFFCSMVFFVSEPSLSRASSLSRANSISRNENIEDVVCISCPFCFAPLSNMKLWPTCDHLICATCYDQVKDCPVCRAPKRGKGRKVNISNLALVRKDEAENDFGLTSQVRKASTNKKRRPADETEAEAAARRDLEAINEALMQDGQEPLATLSQADMFSDPQPGGSGGSRLRGRGGRPRRARGGRQARGRGRGGRGGATRGQKSRRGQNTSYSDHSFHSLNGVDSGDDFRQ